MAEVQSAVRAVLAGASAVTALVGTRIYGDVLPQDVAYPAIRISVISDMSHFHLSDLSGLAEAVVQVDCYARGRLAAASVGDACRLALSLYQGTSASTVVRRVIPDTRANEYEEPTDGASLGYYRHVADYRVFYCEATS